MTIYHILHTMQTHYCLTFEGFATPINLSCDKISIFIKTDYNTSIN